MENSFRSAVIAVVLLAGRLLAPSSSAAEADETGLVPTIWWDFETRPDTAKLAEANKGSASISFSNKGNKAYSYGATNGWAVSTVGYSPYSAPNGRFSTTGSPFTVTAVMTLGSNVNGITLNVRCEAAEKDLVIRRGATAGSLVVGLGPQKAASTDFLYATLADGDTAFHVVSVVAEPSRTSLYVDGNLAASTTEFSLVHESGCASRMQFGERLNANMSGEAANGGLIDDLRIHDAALSPAQIASICVGYGIFPNGYISVRQSGWPMVEKGAFSTTWTLDVGPDDLVYAAIVYGTDAELSSPATNEVGSALAAGGHSATLDGLGPGTTYWWKVVASNGVEWAESSVASFRTLDELPVSSFAMRIPISVVGYGGLSTLTNFPVLVKLAPGSPEGFSYDDCAADGFDLRFASADGGVLPHEVESWNPGGTSYLWVRVSRIARDDAQFSLYYGANASELPPVSPRDVWSRYAAVVHGGSALADSSPSALAVANGGGVEARSGVGIVGGGIHKAERNSIGLNIPNPVVGGTLSDRTKFTLTTWFKPADTGTSCLSASKSGWAGTGFLLLCEQGSYMSVAVGGHQGDGKTGALVKDQWNHVAFSYDTSGQVASLRTYFEGENIYSTDSARTPADGGAAYWTVGSYANTKSADSFKGDMDEIRLFDGIASADWVKAEYDSVVDPDAFAEAGAAVSANPFAPSVTSSCVTVSRSDATFSATLSNVSAETSVSVFYGVDGTSFEELPLGNLTADGTLEAAVSGLTAGTYVWYVRATATINGVAYAVKGANGSFDIEYAMDPADSYRYFTAAVPYDGTPAADVPVLLRISEDAIEGFRYQDVTETGFEFVGADGGLLPYEIDTWDTNGVSLVWVKVPVLASGTEITVRYGGAFESVRPPATDVWSRYVGVWHLNDTNSASAYGSYPNSTAIVGIDGEKALASVAGEDGVVGKSVMISPATEQGGSGCLLGGVFVNDTGDSPLDLGDTFAISGWFRHKDFDYKFDKFFSKRKRAYNEDTPRGAFAAEISNNGGANSVAAYGSGNVKNEVSFAASLKGGWSRIAFVYDGDACRVYQNGAYCGTSTIVPVVDNDGMLCFGNMTGGYGDGTGDCAWCGWIDEVRLADGVPSAEWLAAEYAAMTARVSFGAVATVDVGDPRISPPVVERLADGTFRVTAEISRNEPAAGFVKCLAGGMEFAMSTSDESLPATYSVVLTGLPDGTCRPVVQARGAGGNLASRAAASAFHYGALSVAGLSDTDEETLSPGLFRISRADADATGLPALAFDVAFSGPGLLAVVDPGISTLAIPAGASYVDVPVKPIYAPAVDADAALSLAVSGAFVGTPSTGQITVRNATFDPLVRYVAPSGDDAGRGGTPEQPKKTIASAVAALAEFAQSQTCTVHVAEGVYAVSSPLVIGMPIRIVGDDSDSSRVVVSNTVTGFNWGSSARCFELNHAAAGVSGLTLANGVSYGDGGNLLISSNGGAVSNCVIRNGLAREASQSGAGANVCVLGPGIVTHCVIIGGKYDQGGSIHGSCSVFLNHEDARLENCLVDGYRDQISSGTRRAAGVTVNKGRAVNCTVVNCYTTAETGSAFAGIRVESGGVVSNCVSAANVDASGTLRAFRSGDITASTASHFVNCAYDKIGTGDGSAVEPPQPLAGAVVGAAADFFADYGNGDCRPNPRGALANAGADYEGMASVDLAGNCRMFGKHVDIGCYESQKSIRFFIIMR